MSTLISDGFLGYTDPLYQEGMAYLQNGEWNEAIRCFQDLKRLYPDSQQVQASLEEALFRAGLDTQINIKHCLL